MAGVGMSLYFAPTANLVLSAVRRDQEGKASGVNNTIREIGGVFGVAVLATVFSAVGGYASPQSFVDGMNAAVWVGAVVVGFAVIAALAIPGRKALLLRRTTLDEAGGDEIELEQVA
jgi:multisubunit Na+/H+ antiporter MnhC subunit